MRPLRLAVIVLFAAIACACERPQSAAPATSASPEAAAEDASEVAETTGSDEPIVIPPFDPSLPSLKIAPAPTPQIAAAPVKPRARKRGPSTTTAAAEPAHPSLDALLRAPYEPPAASGGAIDLAPSGRVEPKPPRSLDPLGPSIRLERRGETIGPSGPRQGTYWETDAGVRVPVDKSVSLEGGVRVDTREEPGVKEPQRRSTPRVGVEVKF
jgi:hypothetical protein